MRVTALGSGTASPEADRGPSGFLIEEGGVRWLVDGGSGCLQKLARCGVFPVDLTGGLYTHRHLDHTGDLPALLFAFRAGSGRVADYPIWAGEGFQDFLEGLYRVYGRWIQSSDWGVPVTELSLQNPAEVSLLSGWTLRTRPAVHGAGALHLRVESPTGSSVVFSGDTGPSAHLERLAEGADLLVMECALGAEKPGATHLWPEAGAKILRAAQPRHAWIHHLYPGVNPEAVMQTLRATEVPVERVRDLQSRVL